MLRHKIASISLLLALCGSPQAFSADLLKGHKAWQKGEFSAALQEFKPLAEQGDAYAQYNLGFMYSNGQGVPQNHTEAVKWYRQAAEQGYVGAQVNLGVMYKDNGYGVPQNQTEAAKWYRLAAEQGDVDAQANLGLMYYHGKGVVQSYVDAHMWLNLAASKGDPKISEYRDIVTKKMTTSQIQDAQRLAREWVEKNQ